MVTGILVALMGNEVFPGHTGWWIAYAVTIGVVSLVKVICGLIKELAKL